MQTNPKILIPAKSISLRCPDKNKVLLPYIVKWLEVEGRLQDSILIYDREDMKLLAESYGLETFKEITENGGDILACYECASSFGYDTYFEFPLTQPLRHHGILKEMENSLGDFDFITTCQQISDRSIFLLEGQKFKYPSKERKGSLCKDLTMIDGAAYYIRTEWIKNNLENEKFWSGNFKCITNHSPFLDIDTKEDLQKFLNLYDKI